MKRILTELAVQLVVFVVLLVAVALGAAFFGATTGAVANALAPDFHIQMADRLGLVCAKGETVSIRHDRTVTGVDANGHPYAGQSNDIYCNSTTEGTSRELTTDQYLQAKLAALGVAMAGYSLLCFVPVLAGLEIAALILIHKVIRGTMKPRPAGQVISSQPS
jgi:hypothetical protein